MKHIEKLINIPEFTVLDLITRYKYKVIINVETKRRFYTCPKCKKNTSKIDHRYTHTVRDNSISGKIAYFKLIKNFVFNNIKADYYATGHYGIIKNENNNYKLIELLILKKTSLICYIN